MHRFRFMMMAALALALGGCVSAALDGARTTADVSKRNHWIEKAEAEAGDAEAQFKVGESYCCNMGGVEGAYDNQKATVWLCRAAHQGYGPAQDKLGRIYSGDMVDGVRLLRRVAIRALGPGSNLVFADMWFGLAAAQNVDGAAKRRADVAGELTSGQRAHADALARSWKTAPCTWNDVYGI